MIDLRAIGARTLPAAGQSILCGAVLRGIGAVDARRYGAKGDGVTDDTEAIQAALDTMATTVYVGPGVYPVTLIELNDGQRLIGAGPGATTFKLPDNVGVESAGVLGISCKASGGDSLTLAGFSYDGNESNNREWYYEGVTYEALGAHGINFSGSSGRLSPRHLVIKDLDIYDCVRSNILIGRGTESIDASGLRLRNSAADHLIYSTSGAIGSWRNLTLEGYWRASAIAASGGQSFDGLAFLNMTLNPLEHVSPALINERGNCASGCHWSNVVVSGMDPAITRTVLSPSANGTTMRGVIVTQDPEATDPDGLFYLVVPNLDTGRNIHISDVALVGVSEYTSVFLAQGGDNNHMADRVIIRGVTVTARDGAEVAGRNLIDIRTPCEGVMVSDMLAGPQWNLINDADAATLTNCSIDEE